ncbi:MAG: hypothetical protein R2932_43160 [Caldilineaceae bacterium]
MYRNRFNISGQTLIVSLIATTLLYLLFSIVQPVGAAWGAALLQSVTNTSTTPPYLNYQGTLRDAEGNPISGVHKLTFRIYDDVTAPLPAALWMEEHNDVTVRDGQFSVLLGNNTPVPPALFTGPDMFIGVTVAPLDEMVPRQRFASAPYAMYADHAAALIAPNGDGDHAVHVNNNGQVGVGTTSPQAQLQISTTTGSALQVNAGAQQMVVNTTGLGIGTTTPAVPLQVHSDDADMMLDQNSTSPAQRSEYLMGVDGQRQASLYYDKSTTQAGFINGPSSLVLHRNGIIESNANFKVNGTLHATGDLLLGPNARKAVKIVRITHLPEDVGPVFPNVPASDYECTVGSWSTGRYDLSEDSRESMKAWAYVEDGWWWVGVNFASDGEPDDTPSIDVVCFLKGMVEYDTTYGIREDVGE